MLRGKDRAEQCCRGWDGEASAWDEIHQNRVRYFSDLPPMSSLSFRDASSSCFSFVIRLSSITWRRSTSLCVLEQGLRYITPILYTVLHYQYTFSLIRHTFFTTKLLSLFTELRSKQLFLNHLLFSLLFSVDIHFFMNLVMQHFFAFKLNFHPPNWLSIWT